MFLEDLTWLEAEEALTPEAVVVIPLGAAAKEHGPHLKLNNDFLIAEYFKQRLDEAADVVIAPTLNHHFYPAFVEYPGSVSLRLETARDLVIDVCRSLARFGTRRFYVLNTGVSTVAALKPAAAELAADGIIMTHTDLNDLAAVREQIAEQEGGSHADELETSLMLFIAPVTVDMAKAAKDYAADAPGGLTRDAENNQAAYSPSGVWGNATLATAAKGEILAEAMFELIVRDVEALRGTTAPG